MTGLVRVLCERPEGQPAVRFGLLCRNPARVRVFHRRPATALLLAVLMRLQGWRVEISWL